MTSVYSNAVLKSDDQIFDVDIFNSLKKPFSKVQQRAKTEFRANKGKIDFLNVESTDASQFVVGVDAFDSATQTLGNNRVPPEDKKTGEQSSSIFQVSDVDALASRRARLLAMKYASKDFSNISVELSARIDIFSHRMARLNPRLLESPEEIQSKFESGLSGVSDLVARALELSKK